MSVGAANEIWEGRQGEVDEKGVRRYVRTFRVFTDSRGDGPLAVRGASGLPVLFAPYVEPTGYMDLFARAKRIRPAVTDDPLTWIVTVEYDTETGNPTDNKENDGSSSQPGQSRSPDLEPISIEWGSVRTKRVVTKDFVTELPIANSSREAFDPPFEVDDFNPTVTISRNETYFSPNTIRTFQGCVNELNFLGWADGKVLCQEIKASLKFTDNLAYWRVSYTFEFNVNGWKLRIVDAGFTTTDAAEGGSSLNPVKFRDKRGASYSTPTLLNGSGAKLAAGAEPVILEFDVYDTADFGVLGFGV